MAIIDKQVYKLDIYDNAICSNLYNCSKDEKYCKAMQRKLVFYDRDQVLDMHVKAVSKKGSIYDIKTLKPLEFLQKDESVERIVPLDWHWLGVFFKDKKTGQIKEDKMMYVSYEGDAYICDEISPALNGCVAESVYLACLDDNPATYAKLDEKYFDGTHNEFLSEYFARVRDIVTDLCVGIIKDPSTLIENKEFQMREDINLADIRDAVSIEFRKWPRSADFHVYQILDRINAYFNFDQIISLSNQYCSDSKQNTNNQNEKE